MSGQTIRQHAEAIREFYHPLEPNGGEITREWARKHAQAILDAIDNAYEILEMSRHTGARHTAIEAALALLAPDPEESS